MEHRVRRVTTLLYYRNRQLAVLPWACTESAPFWFWFWLTVSSSSLSSFRPFTITTNHHQPPPLLLPTPIWLALAPFRVCCLRSLVSSIFYSRRPFLLSPFLSPASAARRTGPPTGYRLQATTELNGASLFRPPTSRVTSCPCEAFFRRRMLGVIPSF